jgi:pyridoxine 5-phosphate synthase
MSTNTKLSVNLNKVALLRNQRDVGYPSVTKMAELVIAAGAHGITVHPRPDERHIRRSDVFALSTLLRQAGYTAIELNIEGNPTPQFLGLIEQIRPHQVTLVPDSPDQRTSDHGWDFAADGARLEPIVASLHQMKARVSLFVDPLESAVRGAHATGADRVELYTEPYAQAFASGNYEDVLADYADHARLAGDLGLGVNAGHDLTIDNVRVLRGAIANLAEVSIGHAITADALELGFTAAVHAYLDALKIDV